MFETADRRWSNACPKMSENACQPVGVGTPAALIDGEPEQHLIQLQIVAGFGRFWVPPSLRNTRNPSKNGRSAWQVLPHSNQIQMLARFGTIWHGAHTPRRPHRGRRQRACGCVAGHCEAGFHSLRAWAILPYPVAISEAASEIPWKAL
jgi:hypothetical protein